MGGNCTTTDKALLLTTAFRNCVVLMKPGTRFTTEDAKLWVATNIGKLGAIDQTRLTAEASCRCASQRLIKKVYLVRIGKRNLYERTSHCLVGGSMDGTSEKSAKLSEDRMKKNSFE